MSPGFVFALRAADQVDRVNRQLAMWVRWGLLAMRSAVNILALATTEQTHLSDKKVAEAPSTKVFEPENK